MTTLNDHPVPTHFPRNRRRILAAVALAAVVFILAVARQEGMLSFLPFPLGGGHGRETALTRLPLTDSEAQEAIQREAGHIVACSYTSAPATRSDDGYGALNDDPISGHGPDWVVTEPAAIGAMSLLQAAAFGKERGDDVSAAEAALDGFFEVWLVQHTQGWIADPHSGDIGGMAARIYYDARGRWVKSGDATPGATGIMVSAMWKRYEYLTDTGRAAAGRAWLTRAWPLAQSAKGYLLTHFDPNSELERGPASSPNEWLTDAVAASDALACLDRWGALVGAPDPACRATATRLRAGIAAMKEDGPWKGFYRFRDHARDNQPSDGDSVDQIGFLPYETGALDPGDLFVRQISDGWTVGADGIAMTAQTSDPADWTYYGTHWHHYFAPRLENDYLYPGPGLQLAKVEWKYARRTGDHRVYLRAVNRLRWAVSPKYSALWSGEGGLMDWRDAHDYGHAAEKWARFIDTSGYLIQTVLMINFNRDTVYVPENALSARRCNPASSSLPSARPPG